MTMLEKAARAVWNAREERNPIGFTRMTWEQGTPLAKAALVDDVRAALMAVREPNDGFMLALYPNPKLAVADGGRAAGDRSRRAGRMQVAHFIDAILNEGPSNG